MTLEPDTTIVRSPRAVYRRLTDGEGAVLLHLDSAAYHSVNEVGALVWEHLQSAQTISDLIASLDAELVDQPPEWTDEIVAFVEDLRTRDLVQLTHP